LFLLIPLWLQMKFGVQAISGWIKLKFWQLTILCFLSEWVLSVILFFFLISIEPTPVDGQLRCGFGLAGIAIFGMPISVLILIVAFIQRNALK